MEAVSTPSFEIVDTPSKTRRDTAASPSEKNLMDDTNEDDNYNDDEDMDAMDPQDTQQASPSDQTLLTQEFASPASAASSAATRSSNRHRTSVNDDGNGNGNGDSRGNHSSPTDKDGHDNDDNGSANGNTASSPQCLTQDPDTTRQDQAVDNQDEQASHSAGLSNDDNDVENNDAANSATSSDDDDDDDASSEEDDDEDDDENNPNTLSIMARREFNVKRNEAFMDSLDLANGITPKRKPPSADKSNTTIDNGEDDPEEPPKRRGMLLSTATTSITVPKATAIGNEAEIDDSNAVTTIDASDDHDLDGLASLQSIFCHRQAPIRKLYSVLAAAASQSQSQSGTHTHGSRSGSETASRFVPAPIFVTGSSGSGKTAILRATVQAIEKGNRVPAVKGKVKDDDDGTRVVSAYINCATLDVASIDELVTHAHNQFQAGIHKLSGKATVRKKGKSKRHKKKRKKSSLTTDRAVEKEAPLPSEQSTPFLATKSVADSTENTENAESKLQQADTEAPVRKKRTSHFRSAAPTTKPKDATKTTAAPKFKAAKTRVFSASEDMAVSSETTWSTEQTAVWAFGRALASMFGDGYAGFLILDHAERLLSLSASKETPEPNNFLSQLMSLPRVAGLNLTVIVVTSSLLLEHSRINNLVSAQTSLGTIAADLQPLRIHFSAYRNKSVIKEILRKPRLQRLMIGEDIDFLGVGADARFKQAVFRSFLDTLVQSVLDLTSDIKEFIRLGRSLWPKYVEPLGEDSVDATIQSARKALESKVGSSNPNDSVQRQILTILDRRIFPEIRRVLQRGVFTLEFDSPFVLKKETGPPNTEQHEMPYLCKYLLLAAFICQHNRPDRDKHLFSIQKNGKRRRSSNGENNNGGDLAFGSTSQQPKTLRPRSFPLERMLSVYVSTIGLNQSLGSNDGNIDHDERLRSLGTSTFNESLAHLRDIGLLNEPPSRTAADALRMNDARYWCSLTLDEAHGIAKSVNFPLDRYIF